MSHHTFPVRDAEVRVLDQSTEPDTDDASDMYVLEVFGVSVLIRLRTVDTGDDPQLYVHVDNENRPPTQLAVEVCNGGEARYRM